MWYQCKECKYLARFWNSRDGVTPFGTGCVAEGCGGSMYHEFFGSDQPNPSIPDNACHVWIDMTQEKAQEYADKFWEEYGVKLMKQHPHLAEMGEEKLRAEKVEEIYHDGQAPCLVTRLEWLKSR